MYTLRIVELCEFLGFCNRHKMSDIEGHTATDGLSHQSFVDRYFIRRYKTDQKRIPGEDICILEHSNRICVITLARSHPIVALKKSVAKVDFQADAKTNRLDNKVSGKLKHGAQWINEGSPLCHLTCDDGSVYTVYGCIRGNLVEVNENLVSSPQLLVAKPDTNGYIAVLLPRQGDQQKEMAKLLKEEGYQKVLEKRMLLANETPSQS